MSRATVAVDRIVLTLLSLVLLVAGAAALVWWSGRLVRLPATTDLGVIAHLTHEAWWPWAVGALGVVLVLLGLRWMAAHLPDRGVS